jgi:hypothetical protein
MREFFVYTDPVLCASIVSIFRKIGAASSSKIVATQTTSAHYYHIKIGLT